ncbi:glutamate-rich WD repeat-containing protein 1-like protein [Dinothrombium tinctorium]|uniref:Glutamate-rich WD repeat-containing protein 1 n=1 Tax=Dinothrombium tinctorium TaxID=1965070 RepID=A0A3S3Q3E3_9ACAR|nr:glutamate-rich WD repeat-containing protein 1-like protein [Dinothrombium tinctorium]
MQEEEPNDEHVDQHMLDDTDSGSDADLVSESDEECDEQCEEAGAVVTRTYVPSGDDDQQSLECDESAYVLYQKAETGLPCLSFDLIADDLGSGDERANSFPIAFSMVSGTQGPKVHINSLLVIKMSNLQRNKQQMEEDDAENEDSEESDDEDEPEFQCVQIPHSGCVNRVRSTVLGNKVVAASWSELGNVHLWDLSKELQAVNDSEAMDLYQRSKEKSLPIFTFTGHQQEGFAVDWSNASIGLLATGDCQKNIHIWRPLEAFTWNVDQQPLCGHVKSVEDLQWSPNEANVLASCSVDKTIRVWDIRARPSSSCVITVNDAHEADVNVISWNKKEPSFLLSGGDDGAIKTWDLRQFGKSKDPKPIATFKHHVAAITSIEWHPSDSTVFAASGADNQLTLWDLAVEKDDEDEEEEEELRKLPPQLLFIHQGQKDIKELHWHSQIPGLIISTASNGIDIFRSISV